MRARMNGRLEPCAVRYPRTDTLCWPTRKVDEFLAPLFDLIEEAAELLGCPWNRRRRGPDATANAPVECAVSVRHGAGRGVHVEHRGKHDVWRAGLMPVACRARANPRRATALPLATEEALHQRGCLSEPAFAGQAGCLQHVSRQQGIDGGHNIGLSCAGANFRSGRRVTSFGASLIDRRRVGSCAGAFSGRGRPTRPSPPDWPATCRARRWRRWPRGRGPA